MKPHYEYAKDGNLVITHREFWYDITGSTSEYTMETFELNPAQEEVFPWLAGIAAKYEKYRFHFLRIKYACNCSTNTPGFLGMAVDDDVADQNPDSRSELLAMEGAVTGPVWHEMSTSMPLTSNRQWRYTRVGSYPTDTDPRTSDAGKIFIARGNQSATTGLGSMWIEYKVELSVPQLHIDPPSASILNGGANMFETTATLKEVGMGLTIKALNQMYFKRRGEYLIVVTGTGTNPVFTGSPTVTGGGSVIASSNLAGASYVIATWVVSVLVNTVLDWSSVHTGGTLTGTATQIGSRKYEL
jgi:hypothetical protein